MSAHFEESQFLSHCLPICNRGANFFYNAAYPGIAEGNPSLSANRNNSAPQGAFFVSGRDANLFVGAGGNKKCPHEVRRYCFGL